MISYPHFGPIAGLKPPEAILGKDITWTIKEDGSNIGCYLDADDKFQCRSRNQEIASAQFYHILESTGYIPYLEELLWKARDYNDECVIFGELLTKGKSPTRIELHEKNEYIIFDIWSEKAQTFLPYNKVHQEAYHINVPIVELMAVTNFTKLESLYEFRDELLKECEERKKEGVVGKIFGKVSVDWERLKDENDRTVTTVPYTFIKEKLDSVKFDKVKTIKEGGKILLSQLPDSEIYGAIEKVRTDLGDDFTNTKMAMPLIAQYVGEECRKHHCTSRVKLFDYYKRRLEDLENQSD